MYLTPIVLYYPRPYEKEAALLRELLEAERKQRADLEASGALAKRATEQMGENDENMPPQEVGHQAAVAALKAELTSAAAEFKRLEEGSARTIEDLSAKLD